ncbi:30S ribosomal protein S21 [Candidatus Saccharibacteria bacterium]|nr:30S ribosomal protein S21 [Candidatus Saccharibacteria bacterium]
MSIKVERKDPKEASENILRRFNRKVLQNGLLSEAKAQMRHTRPESRRKRRTRAILRDMRRAEKTRRIKMGLSK